MVKKEDDNRIETAASKYHHIAALSSLSNEK
jgi:hypothetical protein